MLNLATLNGRITKNIELINTSNGDVVANFTLAVKRNYRDKNGDVPTDFISCIIWNKPAEVLAKSTHKGSLISIVGSIETGNYVKNGENRFRMEVRVEKFSFLESKKEFDKYQANHSNVSNNNDSRSDNRQKEEQVPNKEPKNDVAAENDYRGYDEIDAFSDEGWNF